MTNLAKLFQEHLEKRMKDAQIALEALSYKSLILGSGEPFTYFEDDNQAPFRTNPHFAHWCPAGGAHHVMKYEPGKKPLLVYYSPDDYWHMHEKLGNPFWANEFEIVEVGSVDKVWSALGDVSFSVYLGNETKYAHAFGVKTNCELINARLNWYRRFKSEYEIHCMSEANKIASIAHKSAHSAFLNGASEYEIHMNYLNSIQCVDSDLPYTGIVALDKNGAILHYHGREKIKNGKVLLIDSGASYLNYHADITRTYANKNAHSTFIEMLKLAENMQKELCDAVKPGCYFPDLHELCHLKVAEILEKVNIIKMNGDHKTAVVEGLTRVFLPHGLGHMLGIQVHDIGGKQSDEQGNTAPKSLKNTPYRSLRFVGPLEEGIVVTIEPGIYFISTLLNQFKNSNKLADKVNWNLVEELMPCGGIRIEDNCLATGSGHRNLTREFL